MKLTSLVVWRFGVATTSTSVYIRGYLGTELPIQSTYQNPFGPVKLLACILKPNPPVTPSPACSWMLSRNSGYVSRPLGADHESDME